MGQISGPEVWLTMHSTSLRERSILQATVLAELDTVAGWLWVAGAHLFHGGDVGCVKHVCCIFGSPKMVSQITVSERAN